MIASKDVQKLERSSVRLTITVKKDEVNKAYKDMLQEYSKNVQIKGFRKGKVPTSVLETKFGESLKGDVMSRIIEKTFDDAMKDNSSPMLPYASPTIDGNPTLELDADFSYSCIYDVFPQVEIGETKAVEIEVPECSVTKEDEDRELKEIRERNALVAEKADGSKVAKDDIVTVNYCELDDSKAVIPGTERQDFVFTVGTGYNIYKIDDDVIGMKKGEEKIFNKTFPADFEYAELANQTKTLKVTLTQVKERKLPELDDELAQDVSEKYKTLDDLKKAIRAELESQLENKIKQIKENAVVESLIARSKIDLPESMIRMEQDGRLRDLSQQMNLDEKKLMQIISQSGKTLESLLEEWRPASEKALKGRLIIEKLVADRKIEVSDELLEKEYARIAEGSSLSVAEVKDQYVKNNLVERLRDHLKDDVLMESFYAEAKIKKGKKVKFLDLFKESE